MLFLNRLHTFGWRCGALLDVVQPFNKWSRRLLTYRRLRDEEVDEVKVKEAEKMREYEKGVRADDLNMFRRKYFEGFKELEKLRQKVGQMKIADDEKADEDDWVKQMLRRSNS